MTAAADSLKTLTVTPVAALLLVIVVLISSISGAAPG